MALSGFLLVLVVLYDIFEIVVLMFFVGAKAAVR